MDRTKLSIKRVKLLSCLLSHFLLEVYHDFVSFQCSSISARQIPAFTFCCWITKHCVSTQSNGISPLHVEWSRTNKDARRSVALLTTLNIFSPRRIWKIVKAFDIPTIFTGVWKEVEYNRYGIPLSQNWGHVPPLFDVHYLNDSMNKTNTIGIHGICAYQSWIIKI